jgi:hypothetical protein
LRAPSTIVYAFYRNIEVDHVTWYSMGIAVREKARS